MSTYSKEWQGLIELFESDSLDQESFEKGCCLAADLIMRHQNEIRQAAAHVPLRELRQILDEYLGKHDALQRALKDFDTRMRGGN